MHIVFLGATNRGVHVLRRLITLAPGSQFTVCSFREEPHEPPFFDAIAELTRSAGGQLIETRTMSGEQVRGFWASASPDLLLSVSWRYLVPGEFYSRARTAAVFHDSLLPRYRGFSPTVWAMINGEDQTGVTLFHMAEGVDEGDVIDQIPVAIGDEDTIAEVMGRVTEAYLQILSRNLSALLKGGTRRLPQDHAEATYGCKRVPEDNLIDWSRSSREVYNLVRGTGAPYPGAFTTLRGRRVTIWAAKCPISIRYAGRIPGRVVEVRPDSGVSVLTGDGQLFLTRAQLEGEAIVCPSLFLNRLSMTLGT